MKPNEGTMDRLIRAAGGILIGIGGLFLSGAWQIVALIIAAALVFTALIGYCGLYDVLKINTLKK